MTHSRTDSRMTKINRAHQSLKRVLKKHAPKAGLILGSGLDGVVSQFETILSVPYGKIAGFPKSSVQGHAGVMKLCAMPDGAKLLVMQGRFHYYEGHDLDTVTLPVRVMHQLGIKTLVVTNACGGISGHLKAGGLMRISDQINLLGSSPLRGKNLEAFGPRFPDMTHAYDLKLGALLDAAAAKLGISLPSGVYAAVVGPSYETPAEIKMLRAIGADAVGMSTVPEVLVARHQGMRVAGVSMIANLAAGLSGSTLSHAEVVAVSGAAAKDLGKLLKQFFATHLSEID